jgi:hypothetical protein
MNAITLNYKYSGYKGQFFVIGSLYGAIVDLREIGASTGSGALKKATGICGKINFNFILN